MDWCTWINTIANLVKRDRYSWILYEFTQCSMHHFGREWKSIHISLGSTSIWLECGKILCMFGENLFSNNICALKHSYGIIVKVLIERTVFAWIYAIRLPDSISKSSMSSFALFLFHFVIITNMRWLLH